MRLRCDVDDVPIDLGPNISYNNNTVCDGDDVLIDLGPNTSYNNNIVCDGDDVPIDLGPNNTVCDDDDKILQTPLNLA